MLSNHKCFGVHLYPPSAKTWSRVTLGIQGLKYEKRLKVPALQEHHKIARVQWAKTMLSRREGRTNIIFSDEKKIQSRWI